MTDNTDNTNSVRSPKIEKIEWGYMLIEGPFHGKDFKLFPGGAQEWDWNKTNTRHDPGIQPEDIEDLIKKGAKCIVLSRGMKNRLHVSPKAKEMLDKHNMQRDVDYFIETTLDACKRYNQLVEEKMPVGALMHSTC